jgi:hypothetical protein
MAFGVVAKESRLSSLDTSLCALRPRPICRPQQPVDLIDRCEDCFRNWSEGLAWLSGADNAIDGFSAAQHSVAVIGHISAGFEQEAVATAIDEQRGD